jgi:hypothetical protein
MVSASSVLSKRNDAFCARASRADNSISAPPTLNVNKPVHPFSESHVARLGSWCLPSRHDNGCNTWRSARPSLDLRRNRSTVGGQSYEMRRRSYSMSTSPSWERSWQAQSLEVPCGRAAHQGSRRPRRLSHSRRSPPCRRRSWLASAIGCTQAPLYSISPPTPPTAGDGRSAEQLESSSRSLFP